METGGWDLIFEGPLVVELDEQLHFNRYRARTLEHGELVDDILEGRAVVEPAAILQIVESGRQPRDQSGFELGIPLARRKHARS